MPPRLAPACVIVGITLMFTIAAVVLLVSAIMTDHWEHLSYNKSEVEAKLRRYNISKTDFQWFLGDVVAKVNLKKVKNSADKVKQERILYLVPVYGGIWQMCTDLTDEQHDTLLNDTYPKCVSYLSDELVQNESNDWMTRMQNLAISCSIVCLILLACSVFVGAFGIFHKQISAVLVTAVMYILAATFCSFSLSIMHFKRRSGRECGSIDQTLIPAEFQAAHHLREGWSYRLGWAGVSVCLLASLLWYLLFKIMRYGPLIMTYSKPAG